MVAPKIKSLRSNYAVPCDSAVLLALLSELTRLASGQRGRLHPGFRRFE